MQSTSGKQNARRKKVGKWQVGKEWKDNCKELMFSSGMAKTETARSRLVWALLLTSADCSHHYLSRENAEVALLWNKTFLTPEGSCENICVPPKNRHVLCQAHPSTENEKRDHCGVSASAFAHGVAPCAILRLKCHTAENTSILHMKFSSLYSGTSAHFGVAVHYPTSPSTRAIPKEHNWYVTLSASMKLNLSYHLNWEHN